MAGDFYVSLIIRAIDRATAPIRRITKNFEAMAAAKVRADKAFKFAADTRQAAMGMSRFAAAARGAVAAPLKEFGDFQAMMSNVKAVAGNVGDEGFAKMTAQAEELGAKTRWTATQAAEGMKYLAIAGWDAEQVMTGIPTVLNLATAAGSDLGRTSDILSDIMGAFGKDASDAAKVSDVLTAAFTSSNTTLETLFETMKLAGPIASDLDVSLEQVSAMAGLVGSAGIKGSQAGTAMNAAFIRLAGPMNDGRKALKALGIQVADAQGNMRPFPDIIGDVAEKTEKMGNTQKTTAIKMIFGMRAISPLTKLIGIGADKIRDYSEKLKASGGTTDRVAQIMDDNMNGALVRAKSAVSGLMISIGKELAPAVTDFLVIVTGLISRITVFAKANPRLIKTIGILTAGVAVLTTALTGVLFTISALASTVGFASLVAGASSTAAAMLAAMGPIGWVIAGIVALTTAGIILWQNWEAISNWFIGMWERFKNASLATKIVLGALLAPLAALLAPLVALGYLAKLIIENWTPIKVFFVALFDTLIDQAKKLYEILRPIIDPMGFAGKALGSIADIGREIGFIVTGGEAGALNMQTSDFLARTNEGSALGEGKVVIEFRNGIPVPVETETSSGLGIDIDTGMMLPEGAL